MMVFSLLQDTSEGVEELSVEKSISLLELLFSGGLGGTIIICLLGILLFVAVYIYFERLFAIKSASQTDKNFMSQIKDHVVNGKIDDTI